MKLSRLIRLVAFAWLVFALPSLVPTIPAEWGGAGDAKANPTTPKRELIYDGTTAPAAPIVISGEGFDRLILQFDEPGATKSYDYSLTSRICVSTSSCSEWANTAIASGTVSGTGDLELVIMVPRHQYQLTISNLVGSSPVVRVWALKN